MVSFGASTWLWVSPFCSETYGLCERVKSLGFDSIEIPVEDPALIDGPRLKKILQDLDLEVSVCGAFGSGRDLTSSDPRVVESGREYIKRCLDICNDLGAPFFAGPMYSEVGKARQLPPEERAREWQRAVTNLRAVSEEAQARGLQIAIEVINRFESDLVNTTSDTVRLVREIDHPAAKVMLDTFHMTIEESSMREAILAAGEDLIHVQVSENHRGITGTGLTPWQKVRDALRELDYQGKVVIESFTPDNQDLAGEVCIWKKFSETQDEFAGQGLAFLRELFAGE